MIILINGVAIAVGAIVGVFLRNIIAERFSQHIMQGLALCVFLVGIKGAIQIPSSMIMILSLVCGALVGEGIQMEERVRKFADWLQEKTSKGKETNVNLGEGFVAAVMIFCVGALATMGSIQLGLTGEPSLLQTKSILDGITSMSAVGSLLLVGLAMNLLGITKIKVLNFLPAIFMPIIIVPILTMF